MTESRSGRRPYRLGKREASVAETRSRILEAAADAYRDLGVNGTSMQEVARRADVAAGTVLNHFDTPDDLTEAVVDRIIGQLSVPRADSLDGIEDPLGRVELAIAEVYAFYQRSDPWVAFFFRERGVVPAIDRGQERVTLAIAELLEAALGSLIVDADIRIAVGTVMDPGTRAAFMRAGATEGDVAARAYAQVEGLIRERTEGA